MVAVAEGSALRVGEVIKSGPWKGFEVISVYTRAQAIEDGELVDLSKQATRIGFRFPVAATAGVWGELEAAAKRADTSAAHQAFMLLLKLYQTIRDSRGDSDRFEVTHTLGGQELAIWALCGPGDDAEPVITVMLVGED